MDLTPIDEPVASVPHSDANTKAPVPAKTETDTIDNIRTGKEYGIVYPHGIKLALIMGSSYMTMFLVALVRSSISLSPNGHNPTYFNSSLQCDIYGLFLLFGILRGIQRS